MEYRRLGKTALEISALSLGSWVTFAQQINEDVAFACMEAAYQAGVNFFDNAEGYASGQSEIMMGNVLKHAGWKRADLIISTKLFWGGKGPNQSGLSRKHLLQGIRASLERLQLDYVDLVFCHRPDLYTPIEETVWAMHHMVNNGLALYWGTSEWSAEQIRTAYSIARREHLIPPVMEQPEYNMFHRERVEKEYLKLYDEIGLGTTIWSPLASGLLTGKYNDGIPQDSRAALKGSEWMRERVDSEEGRRSIEKARQLAPLAKELGCTLPQLGLAWCLKNPRVSTVITGASRPAQVVENMKALDVAPNLTPEVMERIEGILGNKPAPDIDWRTA
jgi:voltage-dependent potassium channel beta subunit